MNNYSTAFCVILSYYNILLRGSNSQILSGPNGLRQFSLISVSYYIFIS